MSLRSKLNKPILAIICISTGGWAFSFGLGTQLLNLSQKERGWTDAAIGWNTGIYYLGIAVAALFVPRWINSLGIWCPVLGMLLSGLTLTLFPWLDWPVAWFILRFGAGMAGALSLIPLETILSQGAGLNQRSQTFAFYAVALTLGGAIGIGVGPGLFQLSNLFPFFLGGIISVISGLLLRHWLPFQAHSEELGPASSLNFSANLLGYGSAWVQGFLEGGMIAFLALYLLWLGLSPDSAGGMMGTSLAGVILFQVPVGWVADRLGSRNILLTCLTLVIAGLIFLPLCSPGLELMVWLFLLGASSGALYPLGLALLSERIPASGLARAYALFMAMECAGSVVGPITMGWGRDLYGEKAMFPVGLFAIAVVLLPWSLLQAAHWFKKKKLPFFIDSSDSKQPPQAA